MFLLPFKHGSKSYTSYVSTSYRNIMWKLKYSLEGISMLFFHEASRASGYRCQWAILKTIRSTIIKIKNRQQMHLQRTR